MILDVVCEDIKQVVGIVKFIVDILRFAAPIILIVLGSIDLIKAVIAGKEEDIKKNQKTLLKRAIAAVLIFLVPTLVVVLTGLIGDQSWRDCWTSTSAGIVLEK